MDKSLSAGMKEIKYKNLKSLLASQPLKKTMTQLLVSISIFSFVLSCSSLRSSPLIYYQKLYYFSSNSFQLLSIVTNKNWIFLIFNGILIFLAKTSAFVHSPSGLDLNDMLQKCIVDGLQIETESEPILEKNIMLEESGESTDEDEEEEMKANETAEEFQCSNRRKEEEEEEEEEEEMKANEAAEEFECSNKREEEEEMKANEEAEKFECSNKRAEEVSISIAESDEEGGKSGHDEDHVENDESEPKNFWLFDDDEQLCAGEEEPYGGGEEDEIEMLSTEELNQKFDDFIRRMKEEFRISEAQQQQLVMVK